MIEMLDKIRHKIPFWWWLTYDVAVFLVIVFGVKKHDEWFVLGLVILFIAVVIDTVEFIVKNPWRKVTR